MFRPVNRLFTMTQCFKLLALERPRITGTTQAQVDERLAAWKAGALKTAYRKKAREAHPDVNSASDADQQFKNVQAAYEQVLEDLKVNLPRKEVQCPAGHARIPLTAKFCHECGHQYGVELLEQHLLRRGLTKTTIAKLKQDGTYARLQKLRQPQRATEIDVLFHRQRLGLFGPYSGWGG